MKFRKYLNNEELLTTALKSAIFNKPRKHHLEEESASRSVKAMSEIGG